MIRSLSISLALVAAAACCAAESFPVVHSEPITVRIVGGKDGRPLGRLHLTLIAGYDRSDMREQAFREEVLTDAHGEARLSSQMANLPWLQVWVEKKMLCQENPRIASFSVERMRRDGLSTPNHCGMATVEDSPGVFTVFVKGNGPAPQPPVIVQQATQTVARLSAVIAASRAAQGAAAASVKPCCSLCGKRSHRSNSAGGRLVILVPGLAVALR